MAGFLLRQEEASTQRQIEFCYLRTLGRRPTADEQQIAADFLEHESQKLRQEKREATTLAIPDDLPDHVDVYHAAALTQFCLVVFNLNEFIYLD